jgi:splicing factor 45
LAEGKADMAFIQQPWIHRGQVRGLTNSEGTIYSAVLQNDARSCVYIRDHLNVLPLSEFCSRDTTTVRMTYTDGGSSKELIATSAYLPYDSDEPPPTKEVRDITDYCHNRKKQLIMACDAIAHHTLWGSTSTNQRGECKMEFLKEVIDLTLGPNNTVNLVSNWHVSDELSLFRPQIYMLSNR